MRAGANAHYNGGMGSGLSLVVLARCLFPDVWAVDTPLRLPAMIVACLPAFAVTFAFSRS